MDDGLVPGNADKITVNEMYDKYMSQKYNLKPSTRNNYKYCYDHFVRPTFGREFLTKIKYSDVKDFYNWLMFEQGLQTNTLDNIHTQLHPTFDLAVKDDLIRKNPTDGAMTEIKKNTAAFRRKRHALTAPQQKAFMNHLCENYQFHGWEPIITVLLETGMRIGECLAITWNDLDFENRIIKVGKTLTYRPEPGNGCVVHISTPKTEAGERTIPMIDDEYDAFLEEYQIQKVLGFGNSEIDGFRDFVFSTSEGNAYTPKSVNRAIKRVYEDYNKKEKEAAEKEDREPLLLPHFSAHNLRHTFCTRLCENESNLKVIQSVMGHSDIQTTMDIYAECTQEKKQEVFANLNGKIMVK
jgi:integrase